MTLRVLYRGRWEVLVDPAPIETRFGLALADEERLCPLKDVARCEVVEEQLELRAA